MGEKFDNINQIIARMSDAHDRVLSALDNPPDGELDDPALIFVTEVTAAVSRYAMDATRAITSLAALMGVVAMKTDMSWMVDGPGIDMDSLAGGD